MKAAQPLFGDTAPLWLLPALGTAASVSDARGGALRHAPAGGELAPSLSFFHGKGNESCLRQAGKKKTKKKTTLKLGISGRGRLGAGPWRSPSPGNAWEPGQAAGSRSAASFPAFFFLFPLRVCSPGCRGRASPNPCRALPTSQQGAPSDLKPPRRGGRARGLTPLASNHHQGLGSAPKGAGEGEARLGWGFPICWPCVGRSFLPQNCRRKTCWWALPRLEGARARLGGALPLFLFFFWGWAASPGPKHSLQWLFRCQNHLSSSPRVGSSLQVPPSSLLSRNSPGHLAPGVPAALPLGDF